MFESENVCGWMIYSGEKGTLLWGNYHINIYIYKLTERPVVLLNAIFIIVMMAINWNCQWHWFLQWWNYNFFCNFWVAQYQQLIVVMVKMMMEDTTALRWSATKPSDQAPLVSTLSSGSLATRRWKLWKLLLTVTKQKLVKTLVKLFIALKVFFQNLIW